jgi:hypothetical protein
MSATFCFPNQDGRKSKAILLKFSANHVSGCTNSRVMVEPEASPAGMSAGGSGV